MFWQKREKGIPIAMNAILAEEFNKDNPMSSMNYEWMRNKVGVKTKFPDKLWLIAKEKLLLFDYYPAFNGFIISDKLLGVLNKFKKEDSFQYIPLETVSDKKKEITSKKYFYIVFHQRHSLIDYENSKYILRKDANMEFVKKMGFGIEKFNEITLNNTAINDDFFVLNDTTLNRFICFSQKFKEELENVQLYGFDIIHYKAFPMLYNDRFNLI